METSTDLLSAREAFKRHPGSHQKLLDLRRNCANLGIGDKLEKDLVMKLYFIRNKPRQISSECCRTISQMNIFFSAVWVKYLFSQ